MNKYALLLSYCGSEYCGWQRQAKPASGQLPSIQATLEETLSKITEEPPTVVGSGRTDAGVHASGQVAHFVLKQKPWESAVLLKALNSLLPADIRVLNLREVPLDFHAQREAEKKQYSYYFQQGSCALPALAPFSCWIRKRLDLAALREAVSFLVGEHDFKPLQASGAKPIPTVRTVFEAEVSSVPVGLPGQWSANFGLVRVRVVGSGFLKQMVRGIAGTLLQIGEGRRPPQAIQEILSSQDRRAVGPTAPARALWLEQVWYPRLTWKG